MANLKKFVLGKYLNFNISLNCRKFPGAFLAVLQKCIFLSEEILCNLILANCVSMLMYGLDSLFLACTQVLKEAVYL